MPAIVADMVARRSLGCQCVRAAAGAGAATRTGGLLPLAFLYGAWGVKIGKGHLHFLFTFKALKLLLLFSNHVP